MAAPAREEQEDPAVALERLGGIKVEYLHDVIRAGEGERRTSTADDPTNGPGSIDYILRIRKLRQIFRKELGWLRHNLHQLPLVVNPEKTLAIGVIQGDAVTGIPGAHQPRSKKPAGQVKQSLVVQNIQPALFDLPGDEQEAVLNDEELAALQTYFLMTRRLRKPDGTVIVYSELSRAVGFDSLGYVDDWSPRICLPPLEFEPVVDYIEGTDDGPTEYDVRVDEH